MTTPTFEPIHGNLYCYQHGVPAKIFDNDFRCRVLVFSPDAVLARPGYNVIGGIVLPLTPTDAKIARMQIAIDRAEFLYEGSGNELEHMARAAYAALVEVEK